MGTPVAVEVPPEGGWKPTKKWISSAVIGLATILASLIESGNFDNTERGMAATLVIALATGYFVTNDQTPGGVPPKSA